MTAVGRVTVAAERRKCKEGGRQSTQDVSVTFEELTVDKSTDKSLLQVCTQFFVMCATIIVKQVIGMKTFVLGLSPTMLIQNV